jgi:hypothetical protein
MTSRNALFEVEQVEQLALIARLPTHHGKPPPLIASSQTESLFADEREPFFNAIGKKRRSQPKRPVWLCPVCFQS